MKIKSIMWETWSPVVALWLFFRRVNKKHKLYKILNKRELNISISPKKQKTKNKKNKKQKTKKTKTKTKQNKTKKKNWNT